MLKQPMIEKLAAMRLLGMAEALKAAKKILELPQQAVESTKRVLNVHLERAVLATIDYALSAENQSMQTEDFRSIVAKFNAAKN